MIWLTWRQFRAQAAAGFGALVLLSIVLAVTGPGIAADYRAGRSACGGADACELFDRNFFGEHSFLFNALAAVMLLGPPLIGLFWGAPLISREVEAGTHRLVWNQSVTRTRWLAVKLALVGLATMVLSGLISLGVTWWAGPLDQAAAGNFPKLSPVMFDVRGIVPIGYAAFAFALGVTVGLLVRRALPAMAITLALFAVVQIAMPMLVRPHLLPSTSTTTTYTRGNLGNFYAETPGGPIHLGVRLSDSGAWVLTNETLDRSGRVVETVPMYFDRGACQDKGGPGPSAACLDEINRLGYRQRLVYHGSHRFWPMQWIETGIYAVLSLTLAGFCFWRIRRNLS